ncbi:Endo-1,4-beta-xylanase 11A [Lachnellula suecica]|uniref:endo-1,4-beta-xylanase n=1 Tax=Lachnellula suecica TaxID=602035 RepID=A0A8T9CAR3_9HELO|nr:Endo-1,4-beta-xylanase 11A [Lachnellula suecica]
MDFFYSWWTDGTATATYTNQAAGGYSVAWSGNKGNLVGGKGWATGTSSYLAVYGWSKSPLIEYYMVENFGTYDPSSAATLMGTMTSKAWNTESCRLRVRIQHLLKELQPFSSIGLSVRPNAAAELSPRKSFRCLGQARLNFGTTMDYQIVATEGHNSAASSDIVVS